MIMIVQYLCPDRHCICATCYDSQNMERTEVETQLLSGLEDNGVNPHCGICGSTDLRFDHQPSKAKSLDEALQSMATEAIKQLFTRAALDKAGLTFDRARQN